MTHLATSASGLPLVDHLAVLGMVEAGEPLRCTTADVDALLSTPVHDGAVCLLGAAVESGAVEVSAADASRIRDAWAALLVRVVHLDGVLLEAAAVLGAAGVPLRVLKGAAVAHLDEVDPSWRAYGDVDLLVPTDALLDAMDALGRAGMAPLVPPVRRSWAARFAKGVTLGHPSGVQVDLHRTLAAGRWGDAVGSAGWFAHSDTFVVGGVTLPALAGPERLLHACYHALLGGVRGARHRRDILLLTHTVDAAAVDAALARTGRSSDPVAAAVGWAGGPLPAALGVGWDEWRRDHAAAAQRMLGDAGGPATFAAQAQEHRSDLRGVRRRLQFLVPLAWPDAAHLRARGLSRAQYLRRVAKSAAKRGGRA